MKKRFKILIAVLICAVAVTVGAFAVFGDSEPSASVVSYNLTFSDTVDISYAVHFENVPDGAETGILSWDSPQSSYTIDSYNAANAVKAGSSKKITEYKSTVNFSSVGLCYVYDYTGIAAKEMNDDIYTVAYVKDSSGNYTYSELSKFSILQYAYIKLGYTGAASTNQKFIDLLQAMLNYGEEAQKYFSYNTDALPYSHKYYQLCLDGGTLSDAANIGLYREGASVSVTAPYIKDGRYCVGWVDGYGKYVSFSPSFDYTVIAENTTLTAVYSDTN